jgi:hypothetical protein
MPLFRRAKRPSAGELVAALQDQNARFTAVIDEQIASMKRMMDVIVEVSRTAKFNDDMLAQHSPRRIARAAKQKRGPDGKWVKPIKRDIQRDV